MGAAEGSLMFCFSTFPLHLPHVHALDMQLRGDEGLWICSGDIECFGESSLTKIPP